jgi:hypothetical protein
MENDDRLDEELRTLVRSVERAVPMDLEARVRAEAEALRPQPKSRFPFIRRPLVLASLSGAAIFFVAFLLIFPSLHRREAPQIAEIRTEFELADKNIKIIFVQKPDFPVLLTSF